MTGNISVKKLGGNKMQTNTQTKVGSIIQFGGQNWRVLEQKDENLLILLENVTPPAIYHLGGAELHTWEISDARKYLNGDFLNHFADTDRARINETDIVNEDNPLYGKTGRMNNTKDYIFLLSLDEVLKYFGDSGHVAKNKNKREKVGLVKDEYSVHRKALSQNGEPVSWWLRTIGDLVQQDEINTP